MRESCNRLATSGRGSRIEKPTPQFGTSLIFAVPVPYLQSSVPSLEETDSIPAATLVTAKHLLLMRITLSTIRLRMSHAKAAGLYAGYGLEQQQDSRLRADAHRRCGGDTVGVRRG
jgi:hypothetical protein